MVVSGNEAYVADGRAGLQVLDITEPVSPLRLGGNSNWTAAAVTADSRSVYVASESDGLVIFDLVAPPILFKPINLSPDGFRFSIRGSVGLTVRMQHSEDLLAWLDWRTVTLDSSPTEIIDSEVSLSKPRFYRAVGP